MDLDEMEQEVMKLGDVEAMVDAMELDDTVDAVMEGMEQKELDDVMELDVGPEEIE
jgi:hypothetical protein